MWIDSLLILCDCEAFAILKKVVRRMNQPPRAGRAAEPEPAPPGPGPLVVESTALMGGRRELIIRHGEGTYRLRVTASNKLILTK